MDLPTSILKAQNLMLWREECKQLKIHTPFSGQNCMFTRMLATTMSYLHIFQIWDLGYGSYVINEVYGYPHMDYRNLLNIPRALSKKEIGFQIQWSPCMQQEAYSKHPFQENRPKQFLTWFHLAALLERNIVLEQTSMPNTSAVRIWRWNGSTQINLWLWLAKLPIASEASA